MIRFKFKFKFKMCLVAKGRKSYQEPKQTHMYCPVHTCTSALKSGPNTISPL